MAKYIKKNGVLQRLLAIPSNFPASLISFIKSGTSLNSNNAQDAIAELDSTKVKKSGDTMSGNLTVDKQDGTTSSVGISEIVIGNNKGQGVDKNSRGFLYLFSTTGKWARVRNDNGTANHDIYLPDKSGTLSLYESREKIGNVNAYMYRNGNLRLLNLKSLSGSVVSGLTIPVGDRPQDNQIFSVIFNGYLGRLYIGTDGSVSIGHYQTYGSNTLTDDSSSTYTLSCTVAWAI